MPALRVLSRLFYTPLRPLSLSVGFSLILPIRAAAFGINLSSSSDTKRAEAKCTRALFRHPRPAASRESPYPVVFLRTEGLGRGYGLEEGEVGEWVDWASIFAEKGYTAIEIDIAVPESDSESLSLSASPSPTSSSAPSASASAPTPSPSPLKAMTSSLASQIRLLAIPFPPLIIASQSATLLAQAYIEDHPASGVVLIHPPGDSDPRLRPVSPSSSPSSASSSSSPPTGISGEAEGEAAWRWKWPQFKYEPHFPLLVLSSQSGLSELSISSRLVRDSGAHPEDRHGGGAKLRGLFGGGRGRGKGREGADIGVLDEGELNERGRLEVERWMDREGF